ncbi:MAG: lytic transglycosylase domain-containing protein [Bdellovibrionota bacterium]
MGVARRVLELGLFLGSLHAQAAIFEYTDLKELGSCVKVVKKSLDDLEIACPLDNFVSKVRAANYQEPAKRYLVARLLVKALYTKHQTELFKKKITHKETVELFPNLPRSRSNYLQYFFPETENYSVPVTAPSKEASFVSASKSLVDEITFWLEPLKDGSKGDKAFLKPELSHLMFWTLGLGLRFDALAELLETESKELLKHRDFEQLYLTQLSQWIKQFGALPVRAWYSKRLEAKLSPIGGSLSDTNWNYQIESIRLVERPIGPEQIVKILPTLRWLWIVSPEAKRANELKKLMTELGLEKELDSWKLDELNWKEYSWRVQALSRSLSTRSAERMMNKLIDERSKLLIGRDDVWEALQLHIRIYKILDERSKIAPLIGKYEKSFKFFTPPTERGEVFKHYERLYQLAVQFWTLEENKQALMLMDQITASKSKEASSVQLKVAYVRARMNETSNIDLLKKTFKMNLRQDQKLELGWRTFYRLLEGNPKQVAESVKFLNDNTSLFKRMGEYPIKIDFWKAQALAKTKKEKEAQKILAANFASDPYNFYGLFSALVYKDLSGKYPDGWKIGAEDSKDEFKESNYLDAEGYPKNDSDQLISRALVLAKARDFDRALAVLRDAARARPWRSLASVDDRHAKMRDIARLYVALGSKRSAMNLMGGLISAKADNLSSEDWEFIFPRLFESEIKKRASTHSMDPWIVSSVIRQESAFDPRARSPVDALGLMQLLPTTAQKEAKLLGKTDFVSEDLYQPEVAIEIGAHHLSRLLSSFDKSFVCAFAAYNAGIPPLNNWLSNHSGEPLTFVERIPYKETRDYVKKLLRNYVMYRRLYETEIPALPVLLTMPNKEASAKVSLHEDASRIAQE